MGPLPQRAASDSSSVRASMGGNGMAPRTPVGGRRRYVVTAETAINYIFVVERVVEHNNNSRSRNLQG